jgi:hypothetical protein
MSMGVYIRSMETPKSCLNCFLSRSGCRAVLKRMRAMEAGTWIPANYRHDDCPLVTVPPHGSLIDMNDFLSEWSELESYRTAMRLCEVLPAEEGET